MTAFPEEICIKSFGRKFYWTSVEKVTFRTNLDCSMSEIKARHAHGTRRKDSQKRAPSTNYKKNMLNWCIVCTTRRCANTDISNDEDFVCITQFPKRLFAGIPGVRSHQSYPAWHNSMDIMNGLYWTNLKGNDNKLGMLEKFGRLFSKLSL